MATTIGDLQVLIRGDASSLTSALSKSVSGLGALGVATGAAVVAVGAIGVAAVSASLKYEEAFTKIEALSNANAEAIGRWKTEVLTLAGETAQAPQELADALFFLSSAGLKTEDVMVALEASAKASAVGLGETADIARITAAAMNAYADSGITATEVTDTLVAAVKAGSAEPEEFAEALGRVISIAAKAGVGFDEVTASLAGLSNVGIDVNEGVTAITSLLTSMVAPTAASAEALDSLGISTEQLRNVLSEGGLLAAMQLLEERSGGNLDVLKTLIPNVRALRGQLGLTGENAESVAAIFDQVTHAAGSMEEAFATTEESVGFQLEQLKAKAQAMLITIGDNLLPVINLFATAMGAVLDVVGPLAPALFTLGAALAAIGVVRLLVGPVTRLSETFVILAHRAAQAAQDFRVSRDGIGALGIAAGRSRAQITGMLTSFAKIAGPMILIAGAVKLASNVISSMSKDISRLSHETGIANDVLLAYSKTLENVEGADFLDNIGGTAEETAIFAGILGETSSKLQEMGLEATAADDFLKGMRDTIEGGGSAGIEEFRGRLDATVGLIQGFGTALADGSMPLESFITQMETLGFTDLDGMALARNALDTYGKTLQKTGEITTNFLGMTKDEIAEWRVSVVNDFRETFLDISSAETDIFGASVQSFVEDAEKMAEVAQRMARNMEELVALDLNPGFFEWLRQSPGLMDAFVRGTKEQRAALKDAYRTGEEAVKRYTDAAVERTKRVQDGLNRLRDGSPYTAVIKAHVQGYATVEQLESKLEGLQARYDIVVAAHTKPESPWPDEALQAHLIDPLKAWGFREIAGKMTLPLTVGVHTPGAVMGAGATGVTPGGMGRKRTESYLDRERFERDHAYSREYEGWR